MDTYEKVTQTIQSLAAVVQTVAIILGLAYAASQVKVGLLQLKTATDASSAVALGTVMNSSAEFQWKTLQDPALQVIIAPGAKDKLSPDQKLNVVRGMLISNYSFIFDMHKLGQIPDDTWSAITADMHGFFSRHENRKQWDRVKMYYQGEFRTFVDNDLLRSPK
jgi:hypothetical protein